MTDQSTKVNKCANVPRCPGFGKAMYGDFCTYCYEVLAAHYCPEWDYMLIDKSFPEYRACLCYDKNR